jgi:hypothetical protein
MTVRHRLPNRRPAETFTLEGTIGEIFLNNHKSNSAADVNARDAAIVTSIAIQFGADLEIIRKALCRDSRGNTSGPLGCALDRIAAEDNAP